MKNKSLSWQMLLSLAVVFWVLSKIVGGVLGSSLGILMLVVFLMGVIALFRSGMKKRIKEDKL